MTIEKKSDNDDGCRNFSIVCVDLLDYFSSDLRYKPFSRLVLDWLCKRISSSGQEFLKGVELSVMDICLHQSPTGYPCIVFTCPSDVDACAFEKKIVSLIETQLLGVSAWQFLIEIEKVRSRSKDFCYAYSEGILGK